jgi:hypothetical protein
MHLVKNTPKAVIQSPQPCSSKDVGGRPSQMGPSGSGLFVAGGSRQPSSGEPEKIMKPLPFQDLSMYGQMEVLMLQEGQLLPAIKNPGLVVKDFSCPLVENVHYNPEDYVIITGKDLFFQRNLLALFGKNHFQVHFSIRKLIYAFSYRTFHYDTHFRCISSRKCIERASSPNYGPCIPCQ